MINLSVSFDHIGSRVKQCTPTSTIVVYAHEIRKAIEDGITVVAGAGNDSTSEKTSCPGAVDEVIATAGYIPKCPNGPTGPGSIWMYYDDDEIEADPLGMTPICSMQGCGYTEMCSENREDIYWENNSEHEGNKPDVAAPAAIIMGGEHVSVNPGFIGGTSYAAPIVTAQIANWLPVFKFEDITLIPQEIRNGIRAANKDLDTGENLKFDGISAFEEIGATYNIQHEESSVDLHQPR
ncbi:MAG: S8/S53 family peptidase [Halodesulfurarchaeum sp.]|nr:S8/S53 family peptidase [Halodesulfurarchaeum sp.]